MKINGLDGLTINDINRELSRGGKFVVYHYCISIVVATFRRSSEIYFIPAGQSGLGKGLIYSLISFVFGWWGIPWGPIYTIGSIGTNLFGGKNVTTELTASINQQGVE
jgi:hypothetical protein